MMLVVSGRVDKPAFRIANQVHKMRRASVPGLVRSDGFSACYALKDKRPSVFCRRGLFYSQRLFNRNDVPKKFTLRCHRHVLPLLWNVLRRYYSYNYYSTNLSRFVPVIFPEPVTFASGDIRWTYCSLIYKGRGYLFRKAVTLPESGFFCLEAGGRVALTDIGAHKSNLVECCF